MNTMKFLFGSVALFLFVSIVVEAQDRGFTSFDKNEHISYCVTRKGTPDHIVRLDNNWELLLSLREPKSLKTLDSLGIRYTYSQLQLLADWNLIRKSRNCLQTGIVILDSLHTSRLRSLSRNLSERLVDEIGHNVSELVCILDREGWKSNAYSILFSYVIDGWVWRHLEDKGIVRKKELSERRSFWDGEFWTLYPKRGFYCGTNTLSAQGYSIVSNWSEKALFLMKPFLSQGNRLGLFLTDFAENGRITDANIISEFSKFNLFDEKGHIIIPVIEESEEDSIYNLSKQTAKSVADFLEKYVDTEALQRDFGFVGTSQSMIILYHEMLWDTLSSLESRGIITKPSVFVSSNRADNGSISDLIFILKK